MMKDYFTLHLSAAKYLWG